MPRTQQTKHISPLHWKALRHNMDGYTTLMFNTLGTRQGVGIMLITVAVLAVGFVSVTFLLMSGAEKVGVVAPLDERTLIPDSLANSIYRISGSEGEPAEESEQVQEPTPQKVSPSIAVFVINTGGVVQNVGESSLTVMGNGSNFADLQPRELTITLMPTTRTYDETTARLVRGYTGLEFLQTGDRIIVTAPANIRGYTTFEADSITILK